MSKPCRLLEVEKSQAHIELLYDLLSKRQHAISHQKMPSLEEHAQFVQNHPYRVWFIVIENDNPIGAIYLKDDNSIGINFLEGHYDQIGGALEMVLAQCKPLAADKSIRGASFHINVPASDEKLENVLINQGLKLLQKTFSL